MKVLAVEDEVILLKHLTNRIHDAQLEALRWVQKNIAGFGGDPDNKTGDIYMVADVLGHKGILLLVSHIFLLNARFV
ncbi:MAG: carboxylesterase family protein [Oribacterium sp.]|nr:carboxylesterase family protein [Oribacterium sp.]MBP3803240.1 carboxylesterase family protein [Oribacterium sp.]